VRTAIYASARGRVSQAGWPIELGPSTADVRAVVGLQTRDAPPDVPKDSTRAEQPSPKREPDSDVSGSDAHMGAASLSVNS
jgi:hypothetical protein